MVVRAAQAIAPPAPPLPLPPSGFDYRAATRGATLELVSKHPSLVPLVESGLLVAVPRPDDYVERRTDGYIEPDVVWVLGTSHVSRKSGDDARRVIEEIRPDNVVVEVCRARAPMLAAPESEDREGEAGARPPTVMEDFSRSASLGGGADVLLRLALSRVSSRLTASQGVRPGVDMREAKRAAERVGAQLVLGDRPIEISLDRAWAGLTWGQRARLLSDVARAVSDPKSIEVPPGAVGPGGEIDIGALDAETFLAKVGAEYPSLVQALVHERDCYLAWSLKRSKAVRGCRAVVGVVGAGHLPGVVYALQNDRGSLRFQDLVEGRNTRAWKNARQREKVGQIAFELALGFVAVAVWEAWEGGGPMTQALRDIVQGLQGGMQ